jgi:hypothetical protein
MNFLRALLINYWENDECNFHLSIAVLLRVKTRRLATNWMVGESTAKININLSETLHF